MNVHKGLLLTLLGLGLAVFLGCNRPEPVRPLSEEERDQIDNEMKRALQKNRNAVEKKDQKKTGQPPVAAPKTQPAVSQPPGPQPPVPQPPAPQPPAPKRP